MGVDLAKFSELYQRLFEVDYFGSVPGISANLSSVASIRAATAKGAPFLPMTYHDHYFAQVDERLPSVMDKLKQQVARGDQPAAYMAMILETVYGAVYQHGHRVTRVEAYPQLKRFLAVVSNLYRSFVDANKRTAAGVTLVTEMPPLAMFQSTPIRGPFTIESDRMMEKLGTPIGVVSLPATYRDHPVLWSCLAHEVGGHDVVHADPGLVEEMETKTRALLAPHFAPQANPDTATLNAMIWTLWMDEAAADVYGVLNMGPSFAINLAGFLAAFAAKRRGQTHAGDPFVSIDSSELPNGQMEEHPVDVLRFYVAAGAVEALTSLSAAKRRDYVADIEAVATLVTGGATEIGLRGQIGAIPVDTNMKLSDAADAARKVGKMLASEKFEKLNGHCIQDIETWDDADEAAAQAIAARVLGQQSIVATGDDAQLLAGTTLALLQKPALYDSATALLNAALDDSFVRDPIWGATLPHAHMILTTRAAEEKARNAARKLARGKAGKKSAGKKR